MIPAPGGLALVLIKIPGGGGALPDSGPAPFAPPVSRPGPVYIKTSPARRSSPLYGPLKVGGDTPSGGASLDGPCVPGGLPSGGLIEIPGGGGALLPVQYVKRCKP